MNEKKRILINGEQPIAKISNEQLELIIKRDFNDNTDLVRKLIKNVKSDSLSGKNRISAAIIKIANRDLSKIAPLIKIANDDFRDIISKAEYPRASKYGFVKRNEFKLRKDYLIDWIGYCEWRNKK